MSDFRRRLDVLLWFRGKNLQLLLFTPKFPLKAHFIKFQLEYAIHDLVNEKSSKHFEFRKTGGCTVTPILNKCVF